MKDDDKLRLENEDLKRILRLVKMNISEIQTHSLNILSEKDVDYSDEAYKINQKTHDITHVLDTYFRV